MNHGVERAGATGLTDKPDRDLLKLCRIAKKRGASDAAVLSAAEVILDPRVRFKCMIPKCYMSGACDHCPPHGHSIPDMKDLVSRYEWGVFFRVGVSPKIIAAKGLGQAISSGIMDPAGDVLNLGGYYLLVFTLVKILEKEAEKLGYGRPVGFGAGNCRDPLCHLRPVCRNLVTDLGCRHPEMSSPSLESCGVDAFTMAARIGWDMYPIGGSCEPDGPRRGSLLGLVLVA